MDSQRLSQENVATAWMHCKQNKSRGAWKMLDKTWRGRAFQHMCAGPQKGSMTPGEKRHININVLLWLMSRWPWDKRLVVPGLTGPKSLSVRLETQEI